MNAFTPVADGARDVRYVDATKERLDAALVQSRELREELRLSMFRLRLVMNQYEQSVHDYSLP